MKNNYFAGANFKNIKKKKRTYKELVKILQRTLSKVHKRKISLKSTEILTGNFISKMVEVSEVHKNNNLFKKKINTKKIYIPYSTSSFYKLNQNDEFRYLYHIYFHQKKNISYKKKKIFYDNYVQLGLIKKIKFFVNKFFVKKKDNVYYGLWIPKIKLVKTYLSNFQTFNNKIDEKFFQPKKKFSYKLRKDFLKEFRKHCTKKEYLLYGEFLFYALPINFLENFDFILKKICTIGWPSNPKIISTSTSHLASDIFNFYCMEKKKN